MQHVMTFLSVNSERQFYSMALPKHKQEIISIKSDANKQEEMQKKYELCLLINTLKQIKERAR